MEEELVKKFDELVEEREKLKHQLKKIELEIFQVQSNYKFLKKLKEEYEIKRIHRKERR